MQNVEIKSIDVNNLKMQYACFGSGKDVIVLFPGLYTKSLMPLAESVAHYYARFTGKFTVYMLDRVENPPEGYNINNMADDAIVLLDSLKIRNACFIGISMGGMIAQTVAIKRSDLVRKLFLGSTACKVDSLSCSKVTSWVKCALEGDVKTLNQEFAANVYSEKFYQKYHAEIQASLDGATAADLKRFAIFAAAIKDFDVSKQLAQVKCPVLAVGASDDKIFTPEASRLIAENTSGDWYIYDGYGHAVYDEAPDYLERIESFFCENPKS